MPSCAIITCKHRSDLYNLHTSGITFHRFPSDPKVKEKWIEATCRGPVWWPLKRSTICSVHFTENQFRPLPKSRRLFDWAVPTLKLPQEMTTLSPKHKKAEPMEAVFLEPSDVELPTLPVEIDNIKTEPIFSISSTVDVDPPTTSSAEDTPRKSGTVDTPTANSKVDTPTTSSTLDIPTNSSTVDIPTTSSTVDIPTTSSTVKPPTKVNLEIKEKESTPLHETLRERKTRIQLERYKAAIQQKNKKIRTLQKQKSRYRKKIADLENVVKELREGKLLNSDQAQSDK